MCEETEREGRGLENKWIYVLLLFVILGGQWCRPHAQRRCRFVVVVFFFKQVACFVSNKKNGKSDCCSPGRRQRVHLKLIKRKTWMLPAKQRAGGFLHVKLMFLIMCEELIRNGRRSTLPGRTPGLTRLVAQFPWIKMNRGLTQGLHQAITR